MNALVENMNKALSDAVDRAGSGVTFIDYDKYYTESLGRFCEKGYPETNPNRYGLLFYEWDTDDNEPETDGAKAQAPFTSSTGDPGTCDERHVRSRHQRLYPANAYEEPVLG